MLRRPRSWWLALSAMLLSGCQSVFFSAMKVPTVGQAARVERVEFSSDPKLAMDVYRPAVASGSLPTVVFLYGGSWQNGKRSWYRFVGTSLAERGVVVVIPDYRKAPQVKFPVFLEDAALAVAYVHRNIEQFGGDSGRLYLSGHSAGAHIAAMLGTDARYLQAAGMQPRQLAGVIGISGPYDFLPMTSASIIELFNGDRHNAASQPVNFVDGDEPPMLLLHGADDQLVYPRNSQSLQRKLVAAGVPSKVVIYPEIGHMGLVLAFGRGFRGWAPVLDDCLNWINQQSVSVLP